MFWVGFLVGFAATVVAGFLVVSAALAWVFVAGFHGE